MTEKRYIISHNGNEDGILDKTNDKGYYGFELARLVNELSEENEQLKYKINGLKSELTIWKKDANEHIQETNKLFEENKQLKKEKKELKTELQNKTERLFCEIEMKMKYHSKLIDSEKENKDLKDFIRKISTNNEIILANGTIYKINKVIK